MATDLHVEVLHQEITITMPGTSYTITYYKPRDSRILVVKRQSDLSDQNAPALAEFLGKAWWAANDKAHELGWNV